MTPKQSGALALGIVSAIAVMAFVLSASAPVTSAPVVSDDTPHLHVQCLYKGEFVFDEMFDHASIVNGSIIVWVGPESVTIEPAVGETCWIEKAD